MNHGLLAPQFGLGRISQSEVDDPFGKSDRPVLSAAASGSAGPTVTVKRRRHAAGAETMADLQPTQAAPELRGQRVFRLDVQPMGVSSAEHASPLPIKGEIRSEEAAKTAPETPPASPVRSRRALVRKPTLIRHEVFEPVSESVSDATEAMKAAAASADKAAVFAAMRQLGLTLDALGRASDAYAALDRHLNALGVPRSRGGAG
jgi:hypothetical protein